MRPLRKKPSLAKKTLAAPKLQNKIPTQKAAHPPPPPARRSDGAPLTAHEREKGANVKGGKVAKMSSQPKPHLEKIENCDTWQ